MIELNGTAIGPPWTGLLAAFFGSCVASFALIAFVRGLVTGFLLRHLGEMSLQDKLLSPIVRSLEFVAYTVGAGWLTRLATGSMVLGLLVALTVVGIYAAGAAIEPRLSAKTSAQPDASDVAKKKGFWNRDEMTVALWTVGSILAGTAVGWMTRSATAALFTSLSLFLTAAASARRLDPRRA